MKEVFLFVKQNDKKRIFKQTIENKETLYEEIVGTAYNVLLQDCKNDEAHCYAFVKENDVYKACKKLNLNDRLITSISEEANTIQDKSLVFFSDIETKKLDFVAKIKQWIIENHPGLLNSLEKDGLDLSIEKYIQDKDFLLSNTFKFKGDYKTSRNLFTTTFTNLFQEEISMVFRKCKSLTFPNPKVFLANNSLIKLVVEEALLEFSSSENKTIGTIDYYTNLSSFLKGFEFDTKTEAEAKSKSQLDEYLEKAKEYETKNEIEKARSFYEQALLLAVGVSKQEIEWKLKGLDKKDKNKDKLNDIKALKSKAQRAEALGEIQNAIDFYNKAYDKAIEIDQREEQRLILNLLKPLKDKNEAVQGEQNNDADIDALKKSLISAESYQLADNKTAALKNYIEAKQLAVKLKDNKSIKKIDKALKKINNEPVNKVPLVITLVLLCIVGSGYFIYQSSFLQDYLSETLEINKAGYVVAPSDLNVRNGHNKNFPVLAVISRGDSVFVLEENKKTKWKKINFNNKTGWVSGKLISSFLPNDINYLNKSGHVLRSTSGTTEFSNNSTSIKLRKNEKIKILFENTEENKYRIVNDNNEFAFVAKKYIKISNDESSNFWGNSVESRQNGNDLCIRCGGKDHMKYNCPICGGNGYYNAN